MAAILEEKLTESIIGAFYEVHTTLGFGFLEHIYKMALERELLARGHHVAREVTVRVVYKGEELANQRIDMVVDGRVIVETKSTAAMNDAFRRQIRNYLKATNIHVGLLLHFGPKAAIYREIRTPDFGRPLGKKI